ncbi:hypothetical protein H5T87_01295 [bacterium]|nr:hypothetical protein [bacterium]
MRRYLINLILSLSLSLGGVLLLGGGSLDYLQKLKSLNLAPKNSQLGKLENLKIHSLLFRKYPIICDNKEIGYLLLDDKGRLAEFNLPSLEKFVRIKDFPRFTFFLNSHATASAILLAQLGLGGKEPEKVFIASLNVFIEKCLCNLPGKPLIYDIGKGLRDFAKYKGKDLEVREIYKLKSGENPLDFYKREISWGRAAIVSFIYDREGREPDRAKERREADSYVGVGYLSLPLEGKENIFLLLYDGKSLLAKSYEGNYTNLIILGARLK